MNDIDFPITTKDFPTDFFPDFYDRNAETFKREEILSFVKAIKENKYSIAETFALVLAIVYGLRTVEIRNLRRQEIQIEQNIFLVRTAKKGKKRFHLIHPVIKPYFYLYIANPEKFDKNFFKSHHFRSICNRANVSIIKQRGWHAFRRTLVTELLQTGIPDVKVYDFMRWSRREIIYKYYLPEFKQIDREIFEKHPFLRFFKISYN
jgi:integrase